MKKFVLSAGAALCAAVAMPASASTVVTDACVSVSDAHGCLFDGNINNNPDPTNVNGYINAQNAYNAVRDPDIMLAFIGDTDPGLGALGSVTGFGTDHGTWSLPGYDVRYIAVKASAMFVLYEVSGSSGTWNTFDIPYNQNPHAISHLVFFGSLATGVPEPTSWALMILGFGLVGASMRRSTRRLDLRLA